MQPYILGAAGTMNDIVKNNQPQLDALAGDVRGHLPQLGQMAFGQQPGLQAAQGYANDVLGGRYLNAGNPYMQGMVHQGEQDAGNAVNGAFSMHGRTGGGANQQALARGVAQAGNQLRYADYDAERNRMAQAGALLPSLTAAQYAGIPSYLQAAQTAGNLPYAGVGALSPLLGLAQGAGKTTGTQPGGWGGDLLNAAASIGSAAIMASDRRLKTKINLLHRDPDGLGWYEFAYKRQPDLMLKGVMADEVKTLRPAAYVPDWNGSGFDAVNYGAL